MRTQNPFLLHWFNAYATVEFMATGVIRTQVKALVAVKMFDLLKVVLTQVC